MFEILKQRLQGPVFTVFTPFDEDYNVDFDALESYLRYLFHQGARIFYVMAYNSRFSQMSEDEINKVNCFCSKCLKGLSPDNIIIVADPIHCSTETSLQFANNAKKAGADAISLILREKFFTESQVVNHYSYIGESSDFPIVVHEMPFLSGMNGQQMNWPLSVLKSVAELPHVVAMKEDAKDEEIAKFALSLEPSVRIIFAGTKRTFLPLLNHGLKAYLNGISIIDPRIGIAFWDAYESQNSDLMQSIISELEDPFFLGPVKKYGWHRCNKALLQAHDLMDRRDRMPLMHLDNFEFQEILACHKTIKSNLEALLP